MVNKITWIRLAFLIFFPVPFVLYLLFYLSSYGKVDFFLPIKNKVLIFTWKSLGMEAVRMPSSLKSPALISECCWNQQSK